MAKWGGSTAGYSLGEAVTGSDNQLYVCVNGAGCRGADPVGDAGTNWKLANSAPKSDVIFNTTAAGPVILDQSNGHTYRIKVTAGTLGTTQVT